MPLFQRICQVVIGNPKQNNIIFDQNFRISFSINSNRLSTPKISKITIYNLSKSMRDQLKEIMQKNSSTLGSGVQQLLTVYAGYNQDVGLELLYRGNITHIYSRKEVPDVVTTITCADNALSNGNTYGAFSYGAGTNTDSYIHDFVTKLNMPLDSASNSNNVTLAHGFSNAGLVKDCLDDVCKQSNNTHTYENGAIKVLPVGGYSKNAIIDVNVNTGMIYSPEKMESQGTDSDTSKIKDGWRIKMLLQPKIKIGGRIRVVSDAINGIYIAESIEHEGDTARGNWMTTVETKEAST